MGEGAASVKATHFKLIVGASLRLATWENTPSSVPSLPQNRASTQGPTFQLLYLKIIQQILSRRRVDFDDWKVVCWYVSLFAAAHELVITRQLCSLNASRVAKYLINLSLSIPTNKSSSSIVLAISDSAKPSLIRNMG